MSEAKELSVSGGVNKFRHRSFKTRLEDVQINVGKKVGQVSEEPEEGGSFFTESLTSWTDLNCTADFTRFVRDVRQYTGSLTVLLYNKDKVVNILLEHLRIPDSLALEPILCLVTMLARDLQGEIHPYFDQILSSIIPVLKYKDVVIIEAAFNAIAYTFKYLLKLVVKDLSPAFDHLAPLLGQLSETGVRITNDKHHSHHISLFAAESFAYLIRKLPRPTKSKTVGVELGDTVKHTFDVLRQHVGLGIDQTVTMPFEDGLALVYAEAAKSVGNRLHSRAPEVLRAILKEMQLRSNVSDPSFRTVESTFRMLLNHTKREFVEPLWDALLEQLRTLSVEAQNVHPSEQQILPIKVGRTFSLLSACVASRKGNRLPSNSAKFHEVNKNVTKLMTYAFVDCKVVDVDHPGNTFVLDQSRILLLTLLTFSPFSEFVQSVKPLLDLFMEHIDPRGALCLSTSLSNAEWSSYGSVMPIYVQRTLSRCWKKGCTDSVLLALDNGIRAGVLFGDSTSENRDATSGFYATEGLIQLTGGLDAAMLSIITTFAKDAKWIAEEKDDFASDVSKTSKFGTLSAALTVIRTLALPQQDLIKNVVALYKTLVKCLPEKPKTISSTSSSMLEGGKHYALKVLLGNTLETLAAILSRPVSKKKVTSESMDAEAETLSSVVELLRLHISVNDGSALIAGCAAFISAMRKRDASKVSRVLSVENLRDIAPFLIPISSSPLHETRAAIFEILIAFDQIALEKNGKQTQPCPVFEMALEIEQCEASSTQHRQKLVLLKRLYNFTIVEQIPSLYQEVLPRVCIAMLYTNFQPIWQPATDILLSQSSKLPAVVWNLLSQQLALIEDGGSQLRLNGPTNDALAAMEPTEADESTNGLSTGTESPHLTRLRQLDSKSTQLFSASATSKQLLFTFFRSCKVSNVKLDFWNFHCLLLTALTQMPRLAEQHNREIVPPFFKLMANEGEAEDVVAKQTTDTYISRTARSDKQRLTLYLKLFAKFQNWKSLYDVERLQQIMLRLLSRGDVDTQRLVLNVILAWKNPSVVPYADSLSNLIDDVKFRDELSMFPLDPTHPNQLIQPNHRAQLLPILLRLLYGRLISRKGKGTKHGMKARRTAVLTALAGLPSNELGIFMDLLSEPFSSLRQTDDSPDGTFDFAFDETRQALTKTIPMRKKLGFMQLMAEIQKQLGGFLKPFAEGLFRIVLYTVESAHSSIRHSFDTSDDVAADDSHEGDEEETVEELIKSEDAADGDVHQVHQVKYIRKIGLRRMTEFFNLKCHVNFSRYLPAIFEHILSPRIDKLPIECTQSVTPVMELLCAWSKKPVTCSYLVDYNKDTMAKLLACLSATKVRDVVVATVLETIENILAADTAEHANHHDGSMQIDHTLMAEKVLLPYLSELLVGLDHLLHRSAEMMRMGRDNFSRREIAILSRVAPHVKDGEQAARLVELLLFQMKKSSRTIPESVKADVLRVIHSFLPLIPSLKNENSTTLQKYYSTIALFLASLKSRDCRMLLSKVIRQLAEIDPSLATIAELVDDINSYNPRRIDEPDHDRRLAAFTRLNEQLHKTLTPREWLPMLHNLLYFIRDPEEFAIRTNATYGLKQFIERVAEVQSLDDRSVYEEFESLVRHVVYPGIKTGLKGNNETIRAEIVAVLAHAVVKCPEMSFFSDMQCMLMDGDEEASFFTNVHHLQLHRRQRALQRLAAECQQKARIRPPTLVNVFIPIVDHFIFEADRATDRPLIDEAVVCLGSMSRLLPWERYSPLLQTYLNLIPKKPELEKVLVRVVTNILDNFHFDLSDAENVPEEKLSLVRETPALVASTESRDGEALVASQNATDEVTEKPEDDAQEQDDGAQEEVDGAQENEDDAMDVEEVPVKPSNAHKIYEKVTKRILPDLHRLLSGRETVTVMARIPVALAITKLLHALPKKLMERHLPGLLTTVCQILRSHDQEVRNTTRQTLSKIVAELGPAYFGFALAELRTALQKGFQLHVLGFTANSLLNDLSKDLSAGSLDYCLEPLVEVLINDIFGAVGKEKETKEMTGKVKEAKSMGSYASFELVAKNITFAKIGLLLMPLKSIMRESEDIKVMKKVDETLRRISIGLNANERIEMKRFLVFIHGLVTENLELTKIAVTKKAKKTQQEINFLVQAKRDVVEPVDHFATNANRFLQFGLTLLQSFLKNGKIDVTSKSYLGMLDPFVSAVANSTYSKQSKIIELSVKLFSSLSRLPLPALNKAIPVVVARLFEIVHASNTTASDVVQACFKLISSSIRNHKNVEISESQLSFLIQKIRPDIEEPQRQNTTFSLIRTIIQRKYITDDVYDLMKDVSHVMVTSQSSQVRELCRTTYVQFLLDYPHGKARIQALITFLIKNLTYVYESGRASVMELTHSIVQKFPDEVLMEHADALFLSLVLVLVNDEASGCREMAGVLIKALLVRMDSAGKMDRAHALLKGWMKEGQEQHNLACMAAQVYGLAVEAFGSKFEPQINTVVPLLKVALEVSRQILLQAEEDLATSQFGEDDATAEWELAYYSLTSFTKIAREFPSVVHGNRKMGPIWDLIASDEILLHPHSWVRLSAARLLGIYFGGVDPESRCLPTSQEPLPLLSAAGVREISRRSCLQVQSPRLSDDLATQVTKNLVFIGRCLYHLPADTAAGDDTKADDGEEDGEGEDEDEDEDEESIVKNLPKSGDVAQVNAQREKAIKIADSKGLLRFAKKMSFMARRAQARNGFILQRQSIFQWFAAMATFIPKSELYPYLLPIVGPMYRTIDDETKSGNAIEQLKTLTREILDLVQKLAGTTDYLFIYSGIRRRITQVREERRQKLLVRAVVDPEAQAKRKLARNVNKRNSKKRKNEEKSLARGKLKRRKDEA